MAHDDIDRSGSTYEVLGFLAITALSGMTRLAKDGEQSPSVEAHVAHARMAAGAWEAFGQLEVWAAHRDIDLVAAAREWSGLYDELDARTRPSTWWERSVKTWVTIGIVSDLLHGITARHGLFTEVGSWDMGHGEWVVSHLGPALAEDPQLAARLSLWARRVAGEVLGLVHSTLFTHPALVEAGDVDALVAEVITRHEERMVSVGLRA